MTYRIGEHARLRGAFVPDFHVSKGRPTITPSNDHTGMALLQLLLSCLLYTSPSPRDLSTSRMPSSA